MANLLHERGFPPCIRSGMAALPATCGACYHEGTPLYSTAIMPSAAALRLPGFSLSVLHRRASA